MAQPVYVGLDVGGTKVAALAADGDGRALYAETQPTEATSAEALAAALAQTVARALRAAGADRADLAGVGVGVPGQVDPVHGRVQHAVNLNLRDFALGPALEQALGARVALENDVRTAALGAYQFAVREAGAPGLRHLAYVSIGTGIAAGLVLDGALYRGAHGLAGEIGHTIVEPDGERCNCGQRGCLETIVSGPAIARHAPADLPAGAEPAVARLYAAAAAGHSGAQAVAQRVGRHLARALHALVMAYDVERVVLGGGVLAIGERFLAPARAELAALCADSPLAQMLWPPDKLLVLPPGYNPGVWGAVRLARQGHV